MSLSKMIRLSLFQNITREGVEMPVDQETLILIREFLPSTKEPPLLTYFILGLFLGVVVVIVRFKRYKKIRELFMKLF
jgi:hypothetical protein